MTGNLERLNREVKAIEPTLNARDAFRYARSLYLERHFGIGSVGVPANGDAGENFKNLAGSIDWGDWKFHESHALTTYDELAGLVPSKASAAVKDVLDHGYKMSILPLNLIQEEGALAKFIPDSDYFGGHPAADADPYGIMENSVTSDIGNGRKRYIASKTFPHSALFNVHFYCPGGCAGCYKAVHTREKNVGKQTMELKNDGRSYEMVLPTMDTVPEQTEEFVRWLKSNPEVYDVIISGGEPLMLENGKIAKMLDILKDAGPDITRICTGAVFQGLPFRIDGELLDIVDSYRETVRTLKSRGNSDYIGPRFTFQTHLSNQWQITPEAVEAVGKIKGRGLDIYAQVPVQEGVNFYRENPNRTVYEWRELGRKAFLAGVEGYKFIVDMHPRTQQLYVPIEPLLSVWSEVAETHDVPELERPKTLSILTRQGNIVLSGYTLASMDKRIDREKDTVTYGIYNPGTGRKFSYVEPIVAGFNDREDSLEKYRSPF